MADLKISQLNAITVLTPATDVLPVVDVTGTTKKITTNQILGAGGTATLASATITGDLTVDTNVLKVDTTLNRVGVNTASPLHALDVRGSVAAGNGTIFSGLTFSSRAEIGALSNHDVGFIANSVTQYLIGVGGNHTWFNSGSTAMTLNSTGLGVGGSPSARIHAIDSGGVCAAFSRAALPAAGLAAMYIQAPVSSGYSNTPLLTFWYQNTGISNPNNECLAIRTNSTNRIFVNGTGAVALSGGNIAADGVGITFPATQVASSDANTLDDYEEGSFTPTISGSTAAGVGTYSNQIGRYTKIGNQVTVWIRISWSAHTGTGDMRISDLPFTIANVNNLGPCAAIGYSANITLTAGNYLMLFGNPGTTRIDFWQTPTGGGATATVSMDSSADIGITMTYFV